MHKFYTLLCLGVLMLLAACNKENRTPEEQLQKDIEDIKEYLKDKGLNAQETASGLHYIITKEGTGANPTVNATVEVRYKGYDLCDDVFDETRGNETVKFPLKSVIEGWQEAIPLLKPGGTGTFFIPSYLGYGPYGSGSIDGNTVLVFEVELVK